MVEPTLLDEMLVEATELHQKGDINEAERLYRRLLEQAPGHFDALNRLAIVALQRGEFAEALQRVEIALSVQPSSSAGLSNKGSILLSLKRPAEALREYARVLELDTNDADAHYNYGNALKQLKRPLCALASYDRAIALRANDPEAHCNRGVVLLELKRPEEALASFQNAIDLNPRYSDAYSNRGSAQLQLHRTADALASFDKAIELNPRCVEAFSNRGAVFARLKQHGAAFDSLDRAIALRSDYAEAYYHRANVLLTLRRPDEAFANFGESLRLNPDHRLAFNGMARAALNGCDWEETGKIAQTLDRVVAEGEQLILPFTLLAFPSGMKTQFESARGFWRHRMRDLPGPLWQGDPYVHDKIRIAYMSTDFREHAVAHLVAGLIEAHDRRRFEVIAMSFGPEDTSSMRRRLKGAFDQFHDANSMTDREAATLLRELEVDIVVDLNGFTEGLRPEILAFRPAPVQVNYLGYPGTTGANFIDYVIADAVVLPFSQQKYCTERIVHLPHCYQANDRKREIAPTAPTRTAACLPESGFVFCCFNNNYKITSNVFDVWMRLLNNFDESVLWLVRDNGVAERNLRAAAEARGIAASRLVFAERLPPAQHLARHGLADLFLDTLPYNAHTTGSDALWAGLPLITCLGDAFPGRVGASLLQAVGLPELIAPTLAEYEQLARRLAGNPAELLKIRKKLQSNRLSCPLFDTERFAGGIEAAYVRMWERNQAGLPLESFGV